MNTLWFSVQKAFSDPSEKSSESISVAHTREGTCSLDWAYSFRPGVVLGAGHIEKRHGLVGGKGCAEAIMILYDRGIYGDVEAAIDGSSKKRASPDLQVEHWKVLEAGFLG